MDMSFSPEAIDQHTHNGTRDHMAKSAPTAMR